jgi:hypothetical protein
MRSFYLLRRKHLSQTHTTLWDLGPWSFIPKPNCHHHVRSREGSWIVVKFGNRLIFQSSSSIKILPLFTWVIVPVSSERSPIAGEFPEAAIGTKRVVLVIVMCRSLSLRGSSRLQAPLCFRVCNQQRIRTSGGGVLVGWKSLVQHNLRSTLGRISRPPPLTCTFFAVSC